MTETSTGHFVYATEKEETAQYFRSYFKIETVDGGEELGVGAVLKEECGSYIKRLTLAPLMPDGTLSEREVISVLLTENTIAGIMVRHLCSLKNERSEVPADNPNRPYNDEEEHDLYFYEQGEHGENDDF